MQFEHIIDSKAPNEGRPAEPAYMVFSPDEGQYFQHISSGKRHTPKIKVNRGDQLRVPINGEDVTPIREAKRTLDDDELLRLIRKYVQTRGLGLRMQKQRDNPLSGTVHTLPEGTTMHRGRVRYDVDQEVNELPLPKS